MFTKSENNSISICEVKLTFVAEGHCYRKGMPFHFDNKNITCRWVSASTGLLAFVLFMPGIFVEHSVLEEQKENIKVCTYVRTRPLDVRRH